MASAEKKARYDVSRQVKDAMERDDLAEVARILSECSRRDSDSVMTQLVSRDQWDDVQQVIRCVGDEERTWEINGVLVKNSILLSVAEGNWRGIGEIPHKRFLHSTLDWILQQACTRAKQTDIVQYVLPHCEDDQLDSALQLLVTHGLWFAAGRMLQRSVSDERGRLVIQEVCQRADELSLRACIIPFCLSSTIDCLLTELVSRDMWHAVGRVLMRGVTDTQHCWALQKACSRIEGWRITLLLLPHCRKDHCSTVLSNLVSDGQWGSAEKLLHCVNSASVVVKADGMFIDNDSLQMIVRKNWIAILGFLANNKRDIKEVHRFCEDSLRDAKTVFHIYERHNDVLQPVEFDTYFTWVDGKQGFPPVARYLKSVFAVIRDVVIKGHHKETVVCIIPRCAGYQLDYVFTQCFDIFLKSSCRLSHELVFSSTDFPDKWTIHLLDVNAANDRTSIIASSKCAENQLDSVLKKMLTRPAWWALGKVLKQGLNDSSVTRILNETLLYDDDEMIVEHVLPHCTDSQTDLAVTELMSAGQWESVTKLVQLVGDRKQTWTVGGTIVDTTLLHLVAGGRWGEVGDMLQRGVDVEQFRWATDIAMLHADDSVLAEHILCLVDSGTQNIDSVLTKMISKSKWRSVQKLLQLNEKNMWTVEELSVDRETLKLVAGGRWQEVGIILKQGVSDSLRWWLKQTATVDATSMDYIQYILPHCADDQLDSVLTTLVERRLWRAVGEGLKRGVSDSMKQWVLVESCDYCKRDDDSEVKCIVKMVLPHCVDDQWDYVLTAFVERGLWRAVAEVLKRDVSDSVKQWAVKEACQHFHASFFYESVYIVEDILPHCAYGQLDSVLTILVERRLWLAAGKGLKRGVSDSVKQWAVKEACQHFHADESYVDDSEYIIDDILPHCADDQLDSVLTTLVERRLWGAVAELLKRDVSDSLKKWAVKKASQHVHEDACYIVDDILSHCADDQLDSVLTTLVERHLWLAVADMLKRGVSDSVKQWAVKEACQHVHADDCCVDDSEYIIDDILPHCADDQLDYVLTTLVERRLWRAVQLVLKRGVSDSVKRWAVMEACQRCNVKDDRATNKYIVTYILPHCAEDQLDSVLTTLVERRLWRAVGEVLKRGVSDSVKQWVLVEACDHCKMDDDSEVECIVKMVLPPCVDDQWDYVLTAFVKRRLWRAVALVLNRDDSDSVKQWAVKEACQHFHAPYRGSNYIEKHILPHCADDQLDSVLTTLVERRLWLAVGEGLKRGVSDAVKQWVLVEACDNCKRDDDSEVECIVKMVLPHCVDDQWDYVLTAFVERRLWWAVAEVLKRDVSDSVKQWAVNEACQHFHARYVDDSKYIVEDILPHCADDQLDCVLTTLVEQRLWRIAQHVLERVTGELKKGFFVHKTCEHCRSAGVYFSNHRMNDSDSPIEKSITQHSADDNPESLTSAVTTTDACTALRKMSGQEVSDVHRRESIKLAFQCADENTLVKSILPHYVYDSIHSALKMLASRGFWSAFLVLLHNSIIDTLYMWAAAKESESKDEVFLNMVRNPSDGVKDLTPAMWRSVTWSGLQRSLKRLLDWDTPLCEVLCESLLDIAREIWVSGREKVIGVKELTVMEEALSTVEHLHQLIAPALMECKTFYVSDLLSCTEGVRREYAERRSSKCFLFQLYFIKHIVLQYYKRKAWEQMTNTILVALTTVPVVPDVQSMALKVMLRHNRWDIVRHACLSGVCEQDRRQLFQTAVKQRQWSAVKRWADHTLYDDQRLWALGKARQNKRWDVYLKLADHGLSEWERVGVLFRVTMHADWKLVRHMLRTVADVTDMIDLLTNTPGASSKLGATHFAQRMNELKEFEEDLTNDTNTMRTLKTMAKRGKWWVALHNIRHKPNLQHARRALRAAVSSEAWHAMMQLVKLETDVTQRDSLFRDMVRLRQWAVCKELLEQGVSRQQCLDKLSELWEQHQWILVAIVMDCPMDDDSRKEVMHQAIMMREGSVVWECIKKMQTHLSVEEREDMFQLAFSREVWQAVKPLIEEKDVTGIRHRDTALLEAIEQHQWDVVDHCQRHHADINMEDDDGHTPIHRAARKGDWEAVKELTVRDGDPNLLDSDGLSVLHRAIRAKQWDAVSLLIQHHGHIHLAARHTDQHGMRDTRTPLVMLIDARQRELIELTLMWCPDQWKSVNEKGETVLHAAFLSGWLDLVYYLIARKVDPLAATRYGHTALCYAVLCKDCPQRMVAECIKLGFSTHQAHITDTVPCDNRYNSSSSSSFTRNRYNEGSGLQLVSPFSLAMLRDLPVVTQMLYESGANSDTHQFNMTEVESHILFKTTSWQRVFINIWTNVQQCIPNYADISFDTEALKKSVDYLHQVSSTPRSLVSTCRLVISRCLTLSKTRHRDIAQLPLSPMLKNYLMFSDLTDPRYPDLWYRDKE